MADSTIAGLPSAGSVNQTDYLPIDQSGTTKKILVSQLTSNIATASSLGTTTLPVNVSSSPAPTIGQILVATSPTAATWQTNAGSGTVTSVSVTTANGVSGTVATATTTPAISISLAAITPTSINGVTTDSSTNAPVTAASLAGGTLPASHTTITASGVITSTKATGTAPFTIASTTPVANLSIGGNASTATNIAGGASGQAVIQTGSGATSFLNYSPVAGIGTLVQRDVSSGGIYASSFVPSSLIVTSSGSTVTILESTAQFIQVLGTNTQLFILPDATTCDVSASWIIDNNSTNTTTVQMNGGSQLAIIGAGNYATFQLTANGTAAGTWNTVFALPNLSTGVLQDAGGVLGFSTAPTIAGTNFTGTAASMTAGTATVANGLASATTTVVVSAATAPTNGQVLTASSGTAASWTTPAGTGTVTHTGNLTSNALVLGNGTADTKVVAGIFTDGTSVITAGQAGTSVGGYALANATSGTVTLNPATGALGSSVITVPAATGTMALTSSTVTAANGITSATTTVATSAATAPSNGQVLTATSSTAATWQTPTSAIPIPMITMMQQFYGL